MIEDLLTDTLRFEAPTYATDTSKSKKITGWTTVATVAARVCPKNGAGVLSSLAVEGQTVTYEVCILQRALSMDYRAVWTNNGNKYLKIVGTYPVLADIAVAVQPFAIIDMEEYSEQ